ncbi:NADH-quinone oxidoreductase subunit N [Catellatospora sp. TT07R-123]|uniref:NADH-quinone oxidoreductase subunit N n=1 Tax=Catellatospora sp. TT07R-123 TaxID=2733863 RepID=UPI001B17FAD0|nr:proton-conducting transporter membrane subunit [Catellatospora sp. TT07R-123]GHJ46194.1 NADH-quinone oxidoreductase subunit N [Catellatospora sp. TT07R-123]
MTWSPLTPLVAAAATVVLALLSDLFAPGRWRVPYAVALGGTLVTLAAALATPARQAGSVLCAGTSTGGDAIFPVDCAYVYDGRARVVAVVVVALTAAALLLWAPALRRGEAPVGEAVFLLTSAMTGGVALAGAGDLITLIVALETLTVPLYVLVALHRRRQSEASAASVTFFANSVVATAVSLLGAALLYLSTGTVQLRGLTSVPEQIPAEWHPVALTGLVLVLVGLGFKVAAAPLHAWAPATYDGAPVPVAAFLSTASKLGGVAAILIVLQGVLQNGPNGPDRGMFVAAGVALAMLAALSMVLGTLGALRQSRTVRLLAWSSVAQAGFVLAPLGGVSGLAALGPAIGLMDAALAYAVFFVVLEIAAFGAVVALRPGEPDGGSLDDLRGLGRGAPWRAAGLAFALVGLAGLPPVLAGLFAKITVVQALVDVDSYRLAVLVALVSVAGLAVYWRPVTALYRGGDATAAAPGWAPVTALTAAVAAGVLLTVAPQLLYTAISAWH